jgi:hypothetical protein
MGPATIFTQGSRDGCLLFFPGSRFLFSISIVVHCARPPRRFRHLRYRVGADYNP